MSTKGYKYVRVCESYRNAGGKPRSRVIENHGRLDVLEAKDPDYVRKLRDRVKKDNEAARIAHAENLENTAQVRLRRLEKVKRQRFPPATSSGTALTPPRWLPKSSRGSAATKKPSLATSTGKFPESSHAPTKTPPVRALREPPPAVLSQRQLLPQVRRRTKVLP